MGATGYLRQSSLKADDYIMIANNLFTCPNGHKWENG